MPDKCKLCGVGLTNSNGLKLMMKRNGRIHKTLRSYCRTCNYQIRKSYNKEWFRNHPGYSAESKRIAYQRDPKKLRERAVLNRMKTKLDVLCHYSGNPPSCANPFQIHKIPFTDLRCLTLDHINGNGRRHRLQMGISGGGLHRWVQSHRLPDGFQVLCMNCQIIKERT